MASEFPKKISSADLTNEYDEYSAISRTTS